MYPEVPGLTRGRADDGPLALPGNDDRLTSQLRIIALLDGSVERVHIDMDDFSHDRLPTYYSRFMEQGERVSGESLSSLL